MSTNAMQLGSTSPMVWRCRGCGSRKEGREECGRCGLAPSAHVDRSRLFQSATHVETFGNDQVQNNVINVYGDVELPGDWDDEPAPAPAPGLSALERAFMAACTLAMWVSAIALGVVTAFFVVIFIKAFILRGL